MSIVLYICCLIRYFEIVMNILILKCCLKKNPTLNPTPPSRHSVSYIKLIVHGKWVTVRHVITEDLEVYQPVMVWSLYSIFFPSSLCWILRGNSMWVNSLPSSSGLRKPCKERKMKQVKCNLTYRGGAFNLTLLICVNDLTSLENQLKP